MFKVVVSILFAAGAVVGLWNLGWFSTGAAQSLGEPGAAEVQALPSFRGMGAIGPSVGELPLNNIASETPLGDSHTIPPTWLPAILANASASARPLLEDGVVTLDERNSALLAAQACTVKRTSGLDGVVTNGLMGFPGAWATFGGATAQTHELLLAWSAEHQACVVEYFRDVASGWSSAESYARIAPRWDAIATCMRSAGASVREGAEWNDLYEASVRFSGGADLVYSCAARLPQ